jgi:hypothetical protein
MIYQPINDSMLDFFSTLHREVTIHIISFYPKRCWFLLSKRFRELAFEGIPLESKIKAFPDAVGNGNLLAVERLLQDPRVDPSVEYNESLLLAISCGHMKIVEILLQDPRVDPSKRAPVVNGFKPLDTIPLIVVVAEMKNINILNMLLKHPKVDPSVDKNSAIITAAAAGNLEAVNRLLQDPRVDPTDRNNMALQRAKTKGYKDVVKRLLEDPRVAKLNSRESSNKCQCTIVTNQMFPWRQSDLLL